MAKSSKVFISYAHGNQDFQDRVLAFADRLEICGIEVVFDQYVQNPDAGWTKWMEAGIRESDFVVSFCTKTYCDRVNEKQDKGTGLGVQWEGSILYNLLQSEQDERKKVQIVQFDEVDIETIPLPIRGNNRFFPKQSELADPSFEALYRILTLQPRVERPVRGQVVELPAREKPNLDDLTVLPPLERTDVPRSGAKQKALSMKMEIQSARLDSVSTRKDRPGRPPGSGTLLQRRAQQKTHEAMEAYDDDRLDAAIKLSQEALQFNGAHIEALIVMARCYHRTDRMAESKETYENLMTAGAVLSVDNQVCYFINLFRLTGEDDRWRQVEALVRDHPESVAGQLHYALALNKMGNRDSAKEHLSKMISTDAQPMYMSNLAVFEWQDGNVSKASEHLERAVSLNPDSYLAWANLGVARAESRRFGLAIEALHKSLTHRPRYELARYALAEVYALMGDAEAAVVKLNELVKSGSYYLPRLRTERTFDPIRDTRIFSDFLASVPPDLLDGPSL